MSKIVKILFEIWCILFQHFLVRMFCNAEIHGEKIRQGHTHHTSVIRRTSHLSSAFYTWEHYCLFGKSHKNIWHRKMLWSLYDRTICESISFVCPGFKIRRGNGTDRRSKPEAPSLISSALIFPFLLTEGDVYYVRIAYSHGANSQLELHNITTSTLTLTWW